jgi:hypothetical protein
VVLTSPPSMRGAQARIVQWRRNYRRETRLMAASMLGSVEAGDGGPVFDLSVWSTACT